jgi:hypothetical protein
MSLRSRHPRNPGVLGLLGLGALLLLSLAAIPAQGQVATIAPKLSPVEKMFFVRAGTFEVWQDTTRLGTEFYCTYVTAKHDSVVTSTSVVYDLHSGKRLMHYEKRALRITNALDNHLLLYQSADQVGAQDRAIAVTTFDTTATIYHEDGGQGDGNIIAVPPGRVYILDPSVYEQVEALTRDFAQSQVPSRTMHALIPPRDTVITIQMNRGPKEKVQGPGGKSLSAQRVDMYDDLTRIQAWLDDSGNLVRLEAPAQKVRVVRLPAGDAEAQALSRASGPVTTAGSSSVRR